MLPAIVLIAVIGAAIFGGGRSADDPSNPQRPTAAPAEPVVEASLAPDVEALRAAGFPTRALGLPVHSVARTMALRDDGEIRDKVVAVAGWLTVPPEPDCGLDVAVDIDGPYGIGADCRRSTVLTDDAEPVFAVRGGEATRLRDAGADAELRPQALPGVSLAASRGRPDRSGPRDPARARGRPRPVCRSPALGMPVLVVGLRFDIRHRARRLGRRQLAPAPARDLPGRRRAGPIRHGPLADRRSCDPAGRNRADRGDRGARPARDDRPRRRRRGAS